MLHVAVGHALDNLAASVGVAGIAGDLLQGSAGVPDVGRFFNSQWDATGDPTDCFNLLSIRFPLQSAMGKILANIIDGQRSHFIGQ